MYNRSRQAAGRYSLLDNCVPKLQYSPKRTKQEQQRDLLPQLMASCQPPSLMFTIHDSQVEAVQHTQQTAVRQAVHALVKYCKVHAKQTPALLLCRGFA